MRLCFCEHSCIDELLSFLSSRSSPIDNGGSSDCSNGVAGSGGGGGNPQQSAAAAVVTTASAAATLAAAASFVDAINGVEENGYVGTWTLCEKMKMMA